MGRWGGRLAALLAGAPLALAFPRPGWWWLALVGLVPVVPLAVLLAVLWLPLGWLAWALLGGAARPGPARLAAAMVLVPSAFVATEALRSWEGLGGPWGLLGASQWNAPALLSVAAVGGVWGLSFLLVAVNVAVAVAVGRRVPGPTRAAAAAAAVALPLAALGF